MEETWKNIFCRQVGTGKFWNKFFKDNFDKAEFITRSDAVYICKKAQADTYENILSKLNGKVDKCIIDGIKKDLERHWKKDDSGLGMIK